MGEEIVKRFSDADDILWHWYTRFPHLGLSGIALSLGAPLIALQEHGGDLRINAKDLARVMRFPVKKVESAIRELVECGTLTVGESGELILPDWCNVSSYTERF